MKIKRPLWYINATMLQMLIMLSACLKKSETQWIGDVSFHKMMHFFFGLPVFGFRSGRSDSWNLRTIRTNSWKACSTFIRILALHSMYGIRSWADMACASLDDTCNRSIVSRGHFNHLRWFYRSVSVKISFVADHQHRKLVPIFDTKNLPMEFVNFVETGSIVYCEDEKKSLTGAHVLLTHCAEFFLASGVQNWNSSHWNSRACYTFWAR